MNRTPAKSFNKLLEDKNQVQLIKTITALEGASHHAGQLAQALEPGVKGVPALTADARRMIANADVALRDVAPLLQEAKNTLASIDKLAREYTQRADALERVAKSAEQIGAASQGAASTVASDVAPRMNSPNACVRASPPPHVAWSACRTAQLPITPCASNSKISASRLTMHRRAKSPRVCVPR